MCYFQIFDLYQGRTFTNVSIDQINPHLGYTKENIQLVCIRVIILSRLKDGHSTQKKNL